MDDSVRKAMLRWPAVPDVFGWLSLDARGDWRIRDPGSGHFVRVRRASIREFIARNYASDSRGRWYFQNGPQRVFVELAIAPVVIHLEGDQFVDHCGRVAATLKRAWLDEFGALILQTDALVGSVDDRDLVRLSDRLIGWDTGAAVEASKTRDRQSPEDRTLALAWSGSRVPLHRIERATLESRFGFVRSPAAYPAEGAAPGRSAAAEKG